MPGPNTLNSLGLNPLPGDSGPVERIEPYVPAPPKPAPSYSGTANHQPSAPSVEPGERSGPMPVNRVLIGVVAALLLLVGWMVKGRTGTAPLSTPTAAAATTATDATTTATDADIEIKGTSERDEELKHYTLTGHVTNTGLLNAPAVRLDAVFHYRLHDAQGDEQEGSKVSIPLDTFHNLRPGETREFNGAVEFQKDLPGYGNDPCGPGRDGYVGHGLRLDCASIGGWRSMPLPYKVNVGVHVNPAL